MAGSQPIRHDGRYCLSTPGLAGARPYGPGLQSGHANRLSRLSLRVCASSKQVEVLLGWAAGWPRRIWAIEGAAGWGSCSANN
jgi:hypothetical protein